MPLKVATLYAVKESPMCQKIRDFLTKQDTKVVFEHQELATVVGISGGVLSKHVGSLEGFTMSPRYGQRVWGHPEAIKQALKLQEARQ